MSAERPAVRRAPFGADDLRLGLSLLHEAAVSAGVTVEMAVFGGAAMILAWDMRRMTSDVDAVVRDAGQSGFVRREAVRIAADRGWDADWLNDAVKGFVRSEQSLEALPMFAHDERGGLRLYAPSPQYMLAMKCLSMRLGADSSDKDDIVLLLDVLGIEDVDEALDVVADFFPADAVPPKTKFGLQVVFQELMEGRNEACRAKADEVGGSGAMGAGP